MYVCVSMCEFRLWSVIAGVGVDEVDKLGRTALFTACIEGHEDVAELLLKHGANVNLSVSLLNTVVYF